MPTAVQLAGQAAQAPADRAQAAACANPECTFTGPCTHDADDATNAALTSTSTSCESVVRVSRDAIGSQLATSWCHGSEHAGDDMPHALMDDCYLIGAPHSAVDPGPFIMCEHF